MTKAITQIPASQPQPTPEVPMDPLALTFIGLFIVSELLGMSKLKSNAVIQVIIRLISQFKPARQEDELVSELRQDITELTESVQQLKTTIKPTRRSTKSSAD
jgi:hypothetical protein